MDTTRLQQIKDRAAKATHGFEVSRYDHGGGRAMRIKDEQGRELFGQDRVLVGDFYNEGDREFYVHALQDVEDLLAELERLAGGLEKLLP